MIFTIDQNKCTFCGICSKECPPGVITIDRTGKTAFIEAENCIECSHCGMVCPVNAVRADGSPLPEYPGNIETIDPAQIDHFINSKRSVRHYKPESISSGDLNAILYAGSLSATATNSRQVKAVVLQNDEVRRVSIMISNVLMKAVIFGLNPIGRQILKIFGLGRYARKPLLEDYYQRISDTIAGKADVFSFSSPAVIILTYPDTSNGKRFGRTDCALAGQNMMLTAQARGIGSCMIGFAEAALITKKLRKKAGVTSDRKIGLIFTLGYQKPEYYRYPKRDDWKI